MPVFSYRAQNSAGAAEQGLIEAADRRTASSQLRAKGLVPVSLTEGMSAVPTSPSKTKVLVPNERPILGTHPTARTFFQKLERMTSGGLPPGDAVRLLAGKTETPELKALAGAIWSDLAEGRTLAESIRRFPDVFEPGEAGLVEAGESTGTLSQSLRRVITLQSARDELRKKLTAALAYPALVCGLAAITIGLFVFHLLPKLETMMRSLNAEFSGTSSLLIMVARTAVYGLPVAAVSGALLCVKLRSDRATPEGRLKSDALLLRLPMVAPIIRHAEVSGFTGLLGTLLASGIPATEAMRLAEKPVGNEVIRRRLGAARTQINEGAAFSVAFKRHQLIDGADLDILTVNESTGTLHAAFEEIAKAHHEDLDVSVRRLVNTLSGVFLGTAFVVVFFCLVSVVLSVLQVSKGLLG